MDDVSSDDSDAGALRAAQESGADGVEMGGEGLDLGKGKDGAEGLRAGRGDMVVSWRWVGLEE